MDRQVAGQTKRTEVDVNALITVTRSEDGQGVIVWRGDRIFREIPIRAAPRRKNTKDKDGMCGRSGWPALSVGMAVHAALEEGGS